MLNKLEILFRCVYWKKKKPLFYVKVSVDQIGTPTEFY